MIDLTFIESFVDRRLGLEKLRQGWRYAVHRTPRGVMSVLLPPGDPQTARYNIVTPVGRILITMTMTPTGPGPFLLLSGDYEAIVLSQVL